MNKLLPLNNRHSYPECYSPKKLLNYFDGDIKELAEKNFPTFTEKEPVSPKSPELPNFKEAVKLLVIPFIIGLLFHLTVLRIIVALIPIAYSIYYIRAKFLFPKIWKNYESELLIYEANRDSFLKKKEQFKKQKEKYKSDLNSYRFINQLIAKELKEAFRNSPKPNIQTQSPRKGRSELYFQKDLMKYFGEAIHIDCTIEIFNYSKKIDFDFDYPM